MQRLQQDRVALCLKTNFAIVIEKKKKRKMNRKVNKKTRIIVRVKTQREELAQKEICD